jgi:serine/threonine protein kinase
MMDWETFYQRFRTPDFVPGYEILHRLGGGAFGEVFKARKTSIEKTYAIKFLKLDEETQRKMVERELDQVRHLSGIDHPNLVSIEDMGVVMDVPYLVMGYAGEETLARRLKLGPLSHRDALLLFVQAARGVSALHERRLVHFDLKPSNVFLRGEVARVGDYGLAKLMGESDMTLSVGRGTPQYMAPEILKGRADHRADIYSLGVILYEALVGKVPFEATGSGPIPLRDAGTGFELPEDVSMDFRAPLEQALEIDPEKRHETVSDFLAQLGQSAQAGEAIRVDPTGPPIHPKTDLEEEEEQKSESELGSAPTPMPTPAPPKSGAQETVPVPPSSRGGIVGGVGAGLVLAIEVLFSLVGGGLRWAFADRESASSAPVIQFGRVVLLLTVLFVAGALLLIAISNLTL